MLVNMCQKMLTGYDRYLQIPSDAEVKAIPFNALPPNVLQKFKEMERIIDGGNAPHVIVMSPVTESKLQINNKLASFYEDATKQKFSEINHTTRPAATPNKFTTGGDEDTEDCFVPIRSSKEVASTILQLSRTIDDKTEFVHGENVPSRFKDTLEFDVRVVAIRARALYMHKNSMYVLLGGKAKVPGGQDSPENVGRSSSSNGMMKHKCNENRHRILTHHGPLTHLGTDNIVTNGVLVPQQSVIERADNQIKLSMVKPAIKPSPSRRLQRDQLPFVLEQIKRKICCVNMKTVTKTPNPGGSDTNYEKRPGTISSSIREPKAPLETSPCVPEESPDSFCYPSKASPCKERAERAGSLYSELLINTDPQIPQPNPDCEGCTSSDSRSSSPFSAASISPDTSEDFESDENERRIYNKSPAPDIGRTPDQASSSRKRDETTQDEITPRLQLRVRELDQVEENMRSKKKQKYDLGCTSSDSRSSSPFSAASISPDTSEDFESDENERRIYNKSPAPNIGRTPDQSSSSHQRDETTQDEITPRLQVRELDQCPVTAEQTKRKSHCEEAVKRRPDPGGPDRNPKRKVGAISPASSIREPEDPLETSPCVPEGSPGMSCCPIQILPCKKREERAGSLLSGPLLDTDPRIPPLKCDYEGCTSIDSRSSSPFSVDTISPDTSDGFESDESERRHYNRSPPANIGRRRPDQSSSSSRQQDGTVQDKNIQRLQHLVRELDEIPLGMEQIKRNICREVVKKRPDPEGSDTSYRRNRESTSSTSSLTELEDLFETSPRVPQELPGVSCYPFKLSPAKEREERAESSLSKPLDMGPEIPHPNYDFEECTGIDSRLFSPFSVDTISSDTSEGFESDENERCISNKSPSPDIGRTPDQPSSSRQQGKQDKITQRIQQPVRKSDKVPLVMEQTKRKNCFEDAKAVKRRPNPGGSDAGHERNRLIISSTSSIPELEALFESSPEEYSSVSYYPLNLSPAKEKAEKAGTSLSKQLSNMELEIPQPNYDYEECTSIDSTSFSLYSTDTISPDTSEGFESDENERCFFNKSPPPNIGGTPDQASSSLQQDQTTQDEIIQGPQECVRELDEVPLSIEQTKRKNCWGDKKVVKNRPNPGGSDTNYKRKPRTISSTSSIRKPEAPLETSPCVSEESPGVSYYPFKISASKEREERAGFLLSEPLLNMESQISQPNSDYEGCTSSDSRSSSPFSAITISTDTSEGFEPGQNERRFFNKSRAPNVGRRPGQAYSSRQQDETTQDEITQRLQQRVRELNEVVENMRAKKLKI